MDAAVAKRPPRRHDEPIINGPLMSRVLSSALFIVLGTLYVHYNELRDGLVRVPPRQ